MDSGSYTFGRPRKNTGYFAGKRHECVSLRASREEFDLHDPLSPNFGCIDANRRPSELFDLDVELQESLDILVVAQSKQSKAA